jgi:hypothetical protein
MDIIEDKLKIPIRQQGYLDMYNGINVLQTWHYIKINVKTFIDKVFEHHIATCMKTSYPIPNRSTPLTSDATWLKRFNAAIGNPDKKVQSNLAKTMQQSYQSGVGKLIWAMTTCGPNLAYTSIKLSQSNTCPHKLHYHWSSYTTHTRIAYTFGAQHPDQNFPKVPFQESIASAMTSSLITDHNSMHWWHMRLPTLTGLHAWKHVDHLVVSASDWLEGLLPINVVSNQQWQACLLKHNL